MKENYVCRLCESSSSSAPPVWDTVLASRRGIRVTPTLGSLVPGWVLIIPTEHVLCGAHLSNQRREYLNQILTEVVTTTIRLYGSATVFEHGPISAASPVGCTVDHVHIHVVPLAFDLVKIAKHTLMGKGFEWKRYDSWTRVWDNQGSADYAAVSALDGVWVTDGHIGSQFFRRIIAAQLKSSVDYDWRRAPCVSNISATIDAWQSNSLEVPVIQQFQLEAVSLGR